MLNSEHRKINCEHSSRNGNNKSTIVAKRLSVHFQNILTSSTKIPQKYLADINHHLAVFREMLIILGQEKDCPELRKNIRKLRCTLLEECHITAQFLIPSNKSGSRESLQDVNHHYLKLLFNVMQLLLRELTKNYRLTQIIPMDMKDFLENNAGASNIGNAISEILLYKQIKPDFTLEELSFIATDAHEISTLLKEIQEFVPEELNSNVDIHNAWPLKRKRNFFCCGSRSKY